MRVVTPMRRTVLVAGALPGRITASQRILYMKATTTPVTEKEPIGIVISRGSRAEHVPAFFAYVWGPAPETPDDVREVQAA